MIDLLYQALASPLGIRVETEDPQRLRQKLYAERKAAADASLDALAFVPSPTEPNQLWIVKKGNASGS